MKRVLIAACCLLGSNVFAVDQQLDVKQLCADVDDAIKKHQEITRDFVEMVSSLISFAMEGDADAQACCGKCFLKGVGVGKSIRVAYGYYKLSADQGNAAGQLGYGLCLMYIGGDPLKAIRYFKLSADQNFAEAQCILDMFEEWH
jgi:TPR repeat protein